MLEAIRSRIESLESKIKILVEKEAANKAVTEALEDIQDQLILAGGEVEALEGVATTLAQLKTADTSLTAQKVEELNAQIMGKLNEAKRLATLTAEHDQLVAGLDQSISSCHDLNNEIEQMEYEEDVTIACDTMMTKLDGCDKELETVWRKIDQITNSPGTVASQQNALQKQAMELKNQLGTLRKLTLENMEEEPDDGNQQGVTDPPALADLEMASKLMPMVTDVSQDGICVMFKDQETLESQFESIATDSSRRALLANALKERRAYIESAEQVVNNYCASLRDCTAWKQTASQELAQLEEVDFHNLDRAFRKLESYSPEIQSNFPLLQRLDSSVKKLLPLVDQTEGVVQTRSAIHAQVKEIFDAAEAKVGELEACSSDWKQYQHYDQQVEESLNLIQNVNVPSLNLFNTKNIISSCDFNLRNLNSKEHDLSELNKYAERVVAKADPNVKGVVTNHHQELTQRFAGHVSHNTSEKELLSSVMANWEACDAKQRTVASR